MRSGIDRSAARQHVALRPAAETPALAGCQGFARLISVDEEVGVPKRAAALPCGGAAAPVPGVKSNDRQGV